MGRRIIQKPAIPQAAVVAPAGPAAPAEPTGYMDKLKNLIPAETAALYISGLAIIPTGQLVGLIVWAIVCLVLTFLYMAWQTSKTVGSRPNIDHPDWLHVVFASISFIIWVYALGGPFVGLGIYFSWVGTLLIIAWTVIVPSFYQGQPA